MTQVFTQNMSMGITVPATAPKAGLDLQTFQYVQCDWAEEEPPTSLYKPVFMQQAVTLPQQQTSQPDVLNKYGSEELAAEPDAEASAPVSKNKPGSKKSRNKTRNGSSGDWQDNDTTVMLRNISSRYTAEELLVELMDRDFVDSFDMLYLPMDFKSHRNMGYAFINFVQAPVARRFAHVFHGVSLPRYKSSKVLEVTRAFTQGLKANLEAYQKKDSQRVRNPWFRPMIFDVEGSEAESLEIVQNWHREDAEWQREEEERDAV